MFQWHHTLWEFRLSFPLQDEWKQIATTEGSTFPYFVQHRSADYVHGVCLLLSHTVHVRNSVITSHRIWHQEHFNDSHSWGISPGEPNKYLCRRSKLVCSANKWLYLTNIEYTETNIHTQKETAIQWLHMYKDLVASIHQNLTHSTEVRQLVSNYKCITQNDRQEQIHTVVVWLHNTQRILFANKFGLARCFTRDTSRWMPSFLLVMLPSPWENWRWKLKTVSKWEQGESQSSGFSLCSRFAHSFNLQTSAELGCLTHLTVWVFIIWLNKCILLWLFLIIW